MKLERRTNPRAFLHGGRERFLSVVRNALLTPAAALLALPGLCLAPAVSLSAEEADVGLVEEVLVTARHREQDVQDVGVSVRAFSQDDIDQLGIFDLSGLTRFTPSLNIQERGPNRNEMNIRGVTNFLVTQDLVPSSRPVGIYLDDTPVNTLGGSQFDLRYFDLQRIEILRGPQGTLFGEGSSAGAVRYFTENPNLAEFEGRLELEHATMGQGGSDVGARAAVSLPLVQDRLAVRLSGGRFAVPGYLDVIEGDHDVNDLEAMMVRAVVLAEPNDRLSARFMIQYDDSKVGSLGLYTGDPGDRKTNLPQSDDRIDDEVLVTNLKLDWSIGQFVATSVTSYFDRDRQRAVYDQIYSAVGSLASIPFFGFKDNSFIKDQITYEQFSQEVRLVSQFNGPFQFTAGVFYRDFEFTTGGIDVTSNVYPLLGFPSNNQTEILDALGLPTPDPVIVNEGEQFSAFLEVDYLLAERLKLIAGARSHNEKLDVASPSAGLFLGFTPLLLPAISENVDIDVILPKAALEFSWTDDVLLYGQFSSGARNGNINSTATLGSMELFAPGSSEGLAGYGDDRTDTFEAGIKSRFADGRVTFNLSAYYTDYKDLQVVVATPPLGFGLLLNASKAVSKGAEFDLYAEPLDNLSLFLGASYSKAELDDELVVNRITGQTLEKGTPLPFAPEFTVTGGGEVRWPLAARRTLYVNATFSHTGKYRNGLGGASTESRDFTVFGAGAGLRTESWSLDVRASNLTDKKHSVASNFFDAFVIANLGSVPPGITFNENFMLQPRMIRAMLRFNL